MTDRGWPPRIVELNFPDDPIGWPGMADGRHGYPFDADVAHALATDAMMLEDRSDVSLRLGQEYQALWEREHGWKYYRYLDTGHFLRFDGLFVPGTWQDEIERGEWPPEGTNPSPPWPPPPGTPTLEEAIEELNECRRRARLRPVMSYRLTREQIELLSELERQERPAREEDEL